MPTPQPSAPKDTTSNQNQPPTSEEWFEDAILNALTQHNQPQPKTQ